MLVCVCVCRIAFSWTVFGGLDKFGVIAMKMTIGRDVVMMMMTAVVHAINIIIAKM